MNSSDQGEVIDVPLEQIKVVGNPRTVFDKEAMRELRESIKNVGLLSPLLVRKAESGYELIAGERRLRAVRDLEITVPGSFPHVRCVHRSVNDEVFALIQLIENSAREGLTPLDEALAVSKALDDLDGEVSVAKKQLASSLGWGSTKFTEMLQLAETGDYVQRFGRQFVVEVEDLDGDGNVRVSDEGQKLTKKKSFPPLHGSLLRVLIRGNNRLRKFDSKRTKDKGVRHREIAEKTVVRLGQKAAVNGWSVKALDVAFKKVFARIEGRADEGLQEMPTVPAGRLPPSIPLFKPGQMPVMSVDAIKAMSPDEQDIIAGKAMEFFAACGWMNVRLSRD